MRSHLRKVARPTARAGTQEQTTLRTLTLLIPRSYNPDTNGGRKQVELSKLVCTLREIRQLFSGYSVQNTEGWYRDSETGEEFRDSHFRFDIDLVVAPSVTESLRKWKKILEFRFKQREIYMKLSERAIWL
jgi:hypothetical protein